MVQQGSQWVADNDFDHVAVTCIVWFDIQKMRWRAANCCPQNRVFFALTILISTQPIAETIPVAIKGRVPANGYPLIWPERLPANFEVIKECKGHIRFNCVP